MDKWLISPPVVFIVILAAAWFMSRVFSVLAFRGKKADSVGKPYACGEDNYDSSAQPDYSTFFAFAFFFTLAHVATLVMTTVPVAQIGVTAIIITYILGAGVGLYVLLRR